MHVGLLNHRDQGLLGGAPGLHGDGKVAALPELGDSEVDGARVKAGEGWLRLVFPGEWLSEHPLTEADLAREKAHLEATGVELNFS